jgi:hypothetical protein
MAFEVTKMSTIVTTSAVQLQRALIESVFKIYKKNANPIIVFATFFRDLPLVRVPGKFCRGK